MRVVWVADAGATKTEWAMLDTDRYKKFPHMGYRLSSIDPHFRPYLISEREGLNAEVEGWEAARRKLEAAFQALRENKWPVPTELYYYGPALHADESGRRMKALLSSLTGPTTRVAVYHDLLGAARAAWGAHEGIVCILGTGSNCAYWDGFKITRQAGGHGYLLGDEGSGADLGKHFLSAWLHGEVPSDLIKAFKEQNPLSWPIESLAPLTLRNFVYQAPNKSAILGRFALFLHQHKDHPWVAALVRHRFAAFIERTWGRWADLPKRKVRYIGGVARAFDAILKEVTEAYGGQWEGRVESVVEALLEYHWLFPSREDHE
ncbi:MAG: hypothetical protein KatS3mg025_0070 [Bacteroidia bacterium]|nr:MAG: hypothetical protein KatS3mg025_0070 [Bacteroidia bacterium]